MNYNKRLSKEELKRLYVKESKPVNEIAKLMEVDDRTIENWLKQYNLLIRTPIKNPKKELERLYVNKKKGTHGITKITGLSSATISSWIKNYNLSNKLN